MIHKAPFAHRYAYLHGFGSSHRSRKGTALAPAFAAYGVELYLPNLNHPSFTELSFTGSLEALDELHEQTGSDSGPTWCLIGSSMGGYLAARWAELHPNRVSRLLLLCPGFDLMKRWPEMLGQEAYESWRARGYYPFPDGAGTLSPVSWNFIEDAKNHPALPEVPVETLIIHGSHDEVVPVERSRDYAASRANVRFLQVEDDHGLASSLPVIEREAKMFFEIS